MSERCPNCGARMCIRCGESHAEGALMFCRGCRNRRMTERRGMKLWTPREKQLLVAVYRLKVYGAVQAYADLIGRTRKGCMAMGKRLGVTRDPNKNTKFGECEVCNLSAGRHPKLDIRRSGIYVLCEDCDRRMQEERSAAA